MKTFRILILKIVNLLIGMILIFSSCSSDDLNEMDKQQEEIPEIELKARENIILTETGKVINTQVQGFSFKLMNTLAKEKVNKANYSYSPLGISFALGMALNGADKDTYKQIQKTLGFEGYSNQEINEYMLALQTALPGIDNTSTFVNANSLWGKSKDLFLPNYTSLSQKYYLATVKDNLPFDETTMEEINAWSNKHTYGMIPKFFEHANEIKNAEAILLDALYFKGTWVSKFDKSKTENQDFKLADGKKISVPMMRKEKEIMSCVSNNEVTIVQLPYGNRAFNLYAFLPADPNQSIDELWQGMTVEKWNQWLINGLVRYKTTLSIPRFTTKTNDSELVSILETMGIKDAFNSSADFSKMSDTDLFISWVKQMTTIEVEEEGTVVTAISGLGFEITNNGTNAVEIPTLQVDFNHPFGFILSEVSTGTILFAGKVGNPSVN